jgi:16S rRNA (adenine1518-N6/adenine1519-N6)-dimethyltransferase
MRPRKSLGQHFLHDPHVIGRIIAAIDARHDEHFVEIGPGRGALTLPLLAAVERLDVVEVDRALADALEHSHARPGFTVHRADALRFDFTALASAPGTLRLAANLPYNISTPLLFHLLDQATAFRDLHVMLQREVVERMVARPDTGEYGRLTVALAARCHVKQLFLVRPGAFNPPPQVDSAVARIVPDATLGAGITDRAAFDRLLARAFSMRRKQLANSLKGLLTTEDIRACDLNPMMRPGEVSPEGYIALSRRLGAMPG